MGITPPIVVGTLVVTLCAIAGPSAPIDSWALDAVRLDARFGLSASRDSTLSPMTLANPWSEYRVQRYLRDARERFGPVASLPNDSLFAWEEADFFGTAGQGNAASRSKTHKKAERACCRMCSALE